MKPRISTLVLASFCVSRIFGSPLPIASVPKITGGLGANASVSGPSDYSAQFLPICIYPMDARQLELFKVVAAAFPSDSTSHWQIVNDQVEISYGFFQKLTGGNLPITVGGLGKMMADFLS